MTYMKMLTKFAYFFFAVALITTACKNNSGDAVKTGAAEKTTEAPTAAASYAVNTSSSSINWTGSKPTGDQHFGIIKLSGGNLAVANGDLVSGSFDIDMNSLESKDLEAGNGKEKLEGHLKSGDFFEVEKFPAGKFEITNVKKVSDKEGITHNISGNLTLKGVTKSISFDSNVAIINNTVTAVTPSFKINRTEWGVNFNSGILGTVKDHLIDDDVALVISLTAAENVN